MFAITEDVIPAQIASLCWRWSWWFRPGTLTPPASQAPVAGDQSFKTRLLFPTVLRTAGNNFQSPPHSAAAFWDAKEVEMYYFSTLSFRTVDVWLSSCSLVKLKVLCHVHQASNIKSGLIFCVSFIRIERLPETPSPRHRRHPLPSLTRCTRILEFIHWVLRSYIHSSAR